MLYQAQRFSDVSLSLLAGRQRTSSEWLAFEDSHKRKQVRHLASDIDLYRARMALRRLLPRSTCWYSSKYPRNIASSPPHPVRLWFVSSRTRTPHETPVSADSAS